MVGAVFFHLQPKTAKINDANPELINVYETIKCDVDKLIESLKQHKMRKTTFMKSENVTVKRIFLNLLK